MRRLLRVILILAGIVIILTLGFILYFRSSSAKSQIATYLQDYALKNYGLKIQIENLDYTLSPLTLNLRGVKAYGGEKNDKVFFQAKSIHLEILSSLWSDDFHARTIEIDTPSIFTEYLPRLKKSKTGTGTFQVDELTIKNGLANYQQHDLKNIRSRLIASSSEIKVETFQAEYQDADISLHGILKTQNPLQYDFHYEVLGDAAIVQQFTKEIPGLSGPIQTSGQISGTGSEYQIQGELAANSLKSKEPDTFSAQGHYKISNAETFAIDLNIKNVPTALLTEKIAEAPRFASNLSGKIQYQGGKDPWLGESTFAIEILPSQSPGNPLQGQVNGSLRNGKLFLNVPALKSGRIDAKISGEFTRESLVATVKANVPSTRDLRAFAPELAKYPGSYVVNAKLQGAYENIGIIGTLEASDPDFQMKWNGEYWLGSRKIQGSVAGNLNAKFLHKEFSGPVAFEGTVSGSTTHPVLKGHVQGTQLQGFDIALGDLNADLASDGKVLHVAASLPEYSGAVEGEYGITKQDFKLNGHFQDLPIEQFHSFLPESLRKASGTITASIEAAGKLPQWKNSTATLTFQQAQIDQNGISFTIDPESRLRMEQQQILADLNVKSTEGSASIHGTIPMDSTLPVDLSATGQASMSLLRFFTNVLEASGDVRFDIAARGKIKNPSLSGEIFSENFSLNFAEQKIQLENARLNANFSGQDVRVQGEGNLNLNRPDLKGNANIVLNASGNGTAIEKWSGTATITTDNLTIADSKVTTQTPLEVSLRNNIVELKSVNLRAGDLLDLAASGTWDLKTKALHSEVKTSADLALLSDFYPQMKAAGELKATAKIEGTSDAPRFEGFVQLDQGMMRVEGYPMVFENIQLVAPLEKDGLRIDTLTAMLGGGKVEATGRISWDQKLPKAVALQIHAKNVATNYPEDLRSVLNSELSFEGGQNLYLLSGKVDILRSAYREDIDPRGRLIHTLKEHKRELLPESNSFSNRVRLQLDVETVRDAIMDNNIARLRASTKMNLGGTLSEPLLTGRALLREGSYLEFEGLTYTVEEATLDYRNSEMLNPQVFLRLSTEVEFEDKRHRDQCDIELTVTGYLKDPTVQPPRSTSCSDLDSFQLYSLLLTGTTTDLKENTSVFFTKQLAAYLSGSVLYDFQRSISHGLGLTTFALEPLIIASESNPGARLTLGKRLSRELDLAYSLSLSESTDQLWLANYRLRNNLHLRVIEQDDSFTTSLRHRFHFGKGGRETGRRGNFRGRGRTIGTVQYENDTQLTEKDLSDRFGKPGERYDFWKIQDGIEEVKKELQKSGFLFPFVEIQEQTQTGGIVDLRIRVAGQGKRDFVISGTKVDSSKSDQYRRWWREAFSEASVLSQMEDDLTQALLLEGFFRVTVSQSKEDQAGATIYRFQVDSGTKWENGKLVLNGQRLVAADQFQDRLRSLYLSRNEMMSEAIHRFPALSEKISALYAEQGFMSPRILPGKTNYDTETKSVEIEVLIEEGPQSMVAELILPGNQSLPSELVSELYLKEGNPYFPLKIYEDQKTILQYYKSQGYWNTRADAHAEPLKDSSHIAIHYDLDPGTHARIRQVQIRGRVLTREGIIRKELGLRPGDEITEESLSAAQDRLYAFHVFESIGIHIEKTDQPEIYDVIVELVENKRFEMTYGIRYDTEDDFEVEGQLADQNFLGTAQTVFLYGRLNSNEERYQLGYDSPSIFGWNWNSFFLAERVNQTDLNLVQTNFTFQQQTNLSDSILLQSGYRYSRNKTTLQSPFPDDPPEVFVLTISSLQAAVYADFRDNPIDATRGFFVSSSLEYAQDFLGSFPTFLKSYSQFFHYQRLAKVVLASGLRVGLATTFQQKDLIFSERFFAGGSDTLRGFRFEEVGPIEEALNEPKGGEAVFIWNEEVRFPVYRWLHGVVFYDIGNVYNEVSDFSLSDLRHSAGFGVRLGLPYGILGRLDLGFNLDPRDDEPRTVFHFSIGQAF